MGVAVHHPANLEALVLGVSLRTQMIARVDGVDPCRLLDIAAGIERRDQIRSRRTRHQPTCFEGILRQSQSCHGIVYRRSHEQYLSVCIEDAGLESSHEARVSGTPKAPRHRPGPVRAP